VAELVFFSGTMDCGKSTLALQMDYNHRARGRGGVRFSRNDRAGGSRISSRLGLETGCVEVLDSTDFWDEVVQRRTLGLRVDYLICDEAQFYSPLQVEQLARVVDEIDVDVFAFGISADFRTRLFPGSQRLIELADRVQVLQVEALCWCGRRATHNARTVDGVMVTEGAQVVVGDVDMAVDASDPSGEGRTAVVGYETLCRRHFMRRVTAHGANMMAEQDPLLPFEVDACLWQGSNGQRPSRN
jgi:thymidine kinase